MTMTPEAATALRRPFPRESIGKLPKGGIQLDYVGHAAVTDRLLAVDPLWSWEPFAIDEHGLPAFQGKNLWIKLTICGVTRIGVGDGMSVKECIGDAIRNAAMRFGVALDLWAKEDLVEFAQAAQQHAIPAPQPPQDSAASTQATDETSPLLNTRSALAKALYAKLREHGIDKDGATALYRDVTGRDVESSKELSEADARAVLKELDSAPVEEPAADGAA